MKKKHIFIIITIFILIITGIIYLQSQNKKDNSQKTDISPFSIKNIFYYSGITPKNTSFSDNNNWTLSVSQYTDIAIYISNNSETLDSSNTVQNLYIDNIKYLSTPSVGKPNLYYQNPLKFATDYVDSDFPIEHHLNYNILNIENDDNFNYYSTPNYFTDCSIPLTLKYLNSNIINNYQISNSETLFFNGQILRNSKIKLNDLNSILSFNINIVSNDNKLHIYEANITIPLEQSDYDLFDNDIQLEESVNERFLVKQ